MNPDEIACYGDIGSREIEMTDKNSDAGCLHVRAWGVNHGVLDCATYEPVVEKAWRGMVNEIYVNGRVGNVQQTDDTPNYYLPGSSFNFGVGGFLLTGEQVAQLSRRVNK